MDSKMLNALIICRMNVAQVEILPVTTAMILRQPLLVALPRGAGISSKIHATKPRRQPIFLKTYRLELVRSLHTE
jgi:hypothetical protein